MMRFAATRVQRAMGARTRAVIVGHTASSITTSTATALFISARRYASLNRATIAEQVKQNGVYSAELVDEVVNRFVDNFSGTDYCAHNREANVVRHIQGVLTAHAKANLGDVYSYHHEDDRTAFYLCDNTPAQKLDMARRVANFVQKHNNLPNNSNQTNSSSSSNTNTTAAGSSASPATPVVSCGTSVHGYTGKDDKIAMFTVLVEPYEASHAADDNGHSSNDMNLDEYTVEKIQTPFFARHISGEQREVVRRLMSQLQHTVTPQIEVIANNNTNSNDDNNSQEVDFHMVSTVDHVDYLGSLTAVFQEMNEVEVRGCASYSFRNGTRYYHFILRGRNVSEHTAAIATRASMVSLLPHRAYNAITRMHHHGELRAEEAVFISSAILFASYFTPSPTDDDYRYIRALVQKEQNGVNRLNQLRLTLSQEMMSERYMGNLVGLYPHFVRDIFDDFAQGSCPTRRARIAAAVTRQFNDDQRTAYDRAVFMSFLKFNEVIVKHNFFKSDKVALAFRLDARFLRELEYPRTPHGVFLLVGSVWRGFHIRFTDIARGGVRMILSNATNYRKNKRLVFQENYNLAHTQLLKNKDIPEGGSKGTILVSSQYLSRFHEGRCRRIFLQYVDALLDLVVPGESGVVDRLQQPEILFLGPDENTAGSFPAAGARYSRARGYAAWKSFTTGKDLILGGVPHDVYGMTTRSVRAFVQGIYRKLQLDETTMRKCQTGGPDGDLGSNEILQSREKVVGMVDISASLHDPHGLHRESLAHLARERLPLSHFPRDRLSPEGFLVRTDERQVRLPDGTVVEDGARLRDEFHFTRYSDAEVFVPCGGRPNSVTLANVGRLLHIPDATGEAMMAGKLDHIHPNQLKFKIIVEGANLFISQDARLALERCGVVLIKDASANKGGVTSSSLEVYAGLCLSDEEHAQYMSANSATDAPVFYQNYVKEIMERVEENARREFDAIWRESERHPGKPRTLISDELSTKNVEIRSHLLNSDLFKSEVLMRYVMQAYTPRTLLEVVPIETILQRVPTNYQRAICAMWLASRYVYDAGIDSNEFDFFTFMTETLKAAHAAESDSRKSVS